MDTFPRLEELDSNYSTFRKRLKYYVPVFGWAAKYDFSNLVSDLVAGLTVSFLIIPQALSYAQALVKVPPIFGLYAAIIPLLIYSIFGTSKQLSIGPEALVSILVGSSIREFKTWREHQGVFETLNPIENVQPTALLCLMIGVFVFLLGIFRFGFLDSVLSRALLRGFVLAVACVVMVEMLDSLLGYDRSSQECGPSLPGFKIPDGISTSERLFLILANLDKTHLLTASVSIFSIAFLFAIKLLKHTYPNHKNIQLIPEILILVIISISLTIIFKWNCNGLAVLGNISIDYDTNVNIRPIPTLPKIRHLLLSAILISVIGFVESMAVAKTYALKHNYVVSPNRELVALGLANIVSSVFGCFPAFGSLSRSSINDAARAKTQLSGLVTAVTVLIVSFSLLPVFAYLPKAVCSSIICIAASKLIDLQDVLFIIKLNAWRDLALLIGTFLSTVFISIESGTLISVVISLFLVLKHTAKTRIVLLGQKVVYDPNTGLYKTKFRAIHDEAGPLEKIDNIIVIRLEEGMFFGNVGQLKDRLKRIEDHGDLDVHPSEEPANISQSVFEDSTPISPLLPRVAGCRDLRAIIFEMSSVSDIDASAVQTLLETVQYYKQRDIPIAFVKLRETCRAYFEKSGIIDIAPELYFGKIRDALDFFQTRNSPLPMVQSPSYNVNAHFPFRRSYASDDLERTESNESK